MIWLPTEAITIVAAQVFEDRAFASWPAQTNTVTGTPLRIPYGNKDVAMKLGARYGTMGWYAPLGVDLSAFGERGWL